MKNLLFFLKKLFKRNLYLKLSVIGVVGIVSSVYLFSLTFPEKDELNKGLVLGDICNVSIEQSKCYKGDFPTPVFKWDYCDINYARNQKIFRVQVDNQAYHNSSFSSPEVDSGDVLSSDARYAVNSPGLNFNTLYYWGVTVVNNSGFKTGWWGWGDKNFTTSPSCK